MAVYQIYDKVFKKILTLSSTSIINLINGLFDAHYPPDSTITYNWTEFEDDALRRILADTIITINETDSYHLEAQMTEQEDIIFRVFDYGYAHARRNAGNDLSSGTLRFPEPKIIYLYTKTPAPDYYELLLDFGSQGTFHYHVSTLKYLETSPEELTRRKMIILIPFELLKLRDAMKKERSPENLEALKNLIQNDIIGSIKKNLDVGNITADDARRLRRLTQQLYDHIYSRYEEMEVLNEMTDESLMLDIDIIEKEHEKQLAEKDSVISEQSLALSEKDATISEKNAVISEKEAEIALLKQQLAELQKIQHQK
ncbi:MAG: hypothetical protein J5986_14635 [Roseburia sp.]|nr:hypothetical protein [Roseburia sp.]